MKPNEIVEEVKASGITLVVVALASAGVKWSFSSLMLTKVCDCECRRRRTGNFQGIV
jgi:hypothetical protein